MAELYTGYPLFPGENEVEQLACLMEVLGTPPDDLIAVATRRRLFFGKKTKHLYNNKSLYSFFLQIHEETPDASQIQRAGRGSREAKT